MARRQLRSSLFGLALLLGTSIATLLFGQEAFGQEAGYPKSEEIRTRYGFAEWPGATGSVFAGLNPATLTWNDWAPVGKPFVQVIEVKENDPYRTTQATGHGVRIDRKLAKKGIDATRHHFRVRVQVAPTRAGARTLLLNQFLSHHSVPPAAAPALPWGETRLTGIGDVAFAHQKASETHRIVFVRGNVFIRIDALGAATPSTLELAKRIDIAIGKSDRAGRYADLERPQPTRFTLEAPTDSKKAALGNARSLDFAVDTGHVARWIAPHGDLVRDLYSKGDYGYVPRRAGPLRLVVVDHRGCFGIYTQLVQVEE